MTTVASLLVLMLSTVPLLRQMMFFSVVGISISFLFFYWIIRAKPEWFEVVPFQVNVSPKPWKNWSMLGLVLISLFGLLSIKPDLSMKQFDFQTDQTREVSTWMFQAIGLTPPLFEIHAATAVVSDSAARKEWATQHQISLETLSNYLPTPIEQSKNLETWSHSSWINALSANQKTFFKPYLDLTSDDARLNDGWLNQKSYLAHLHNENEWISLWLPETEAQTKEIRTVFPNVISLRDVVELFPKTLSDELTWMVPLSILLAALIHFVYYRSVSLALTALIPFFTGVGLITIATWIFHLHISFISVIGLIMIFGFSLDYGIFATDASIATNVSFATERKRSEKNSPAFETSGMWTAVILAASTTLAGFVPLVFCHHPVLKHLGQTLFWGAIGTFLGAWWAVPSVVNYFNLRTKREHH